MNPQILRPAGLLATSLTLLGAPSAAQVLHESAKLLAGDAGTNWSFGWDVAVDGDTLAASAPFADDDELGTGSVYVFGRSGTAWTQQAKLVPNSQSQGGSATFGASVALESGRLLVGASFDQGFIDFTGAAHVFEQVGGVWTRSQKLTASDGTTGALFGFQIDLSGNSAVVAAVGDTFNRGAAYVFVESGGWTQQAKLAASDGVSGDQFGRGVAIDDDTVAVSSFSGSDGAVYVFERSGTTWTQMARLVPAVPNFSFGQDVSLEGDLLLAGGDGDASGALLYRRAGTGWTFVTSLAPGDSSAGSFSGFSTDLDAGRALVGTPLQSVVGGNSGLGSAFASSGDVWGEQVQLLGSDTAAGDLLGYGVSISGTTFALGAPRDDDQGSNSGAVYVFEVPSVSTLYCAGKTNSLGCIPFLSTSGLPQALSPLAFDIRADDLLPGEAALLLYGFGRANLDFQGGKLCVKAPIKRSFPIAKTAATGIPPCTGVFSRDFNTVIQSGFDPLLTAGQTVRVQCLARDPGDSFGSALSNAVSFFIGN